MKKTKKKCHWFASTTDRQFYAIKVLNHWRLVSKVGYIIYEGRYIGDIKDYTKTVLGFHYLGYM